MFLSNASRQTDRQTYRWTDGRTDGRAGGRRAGGRADGRTARQTYPNAVPSHSSPGATVTIRRSVCIIQTHQTLFRSQITYAHLVPPILLFLAKHPLVKAEDFPSVHTITTAAAPCGANLMKEVRDRLGIPRIRQGTASQH